MCKGNPTLWRETSAAGTGFFSDFNKVNIKSDLTRKIVGQYKKDQEMQIFMTVLVEAS